MTKLKFTRAPRNTIASNPSIDRRRVSRRSAATGDATVEIPAASQESPVPAPPKAPSGKLGAVVALMRRPEGATVAQMVQATGWQAHSVRGAMAGALKRKHGLKIIGEPTEAGRVYRIDSGQTT